MTMYKRYLWILYLLFFCTCQKQDKTTGKTVFKINKNNNYFRYSKHLRLTQAQGYEILSIITPWQGSTITLDYNIIPKKTSKVIKNNLKTQNIKVPVESIVPNNTTYLHGFELLNFYSSIIGFPGTDLISSPKLRNLIKKGEILNLGGEKGLNMEKLILNKPKVLLDFGSQANYDRMDQFQDHGITVMLFADYMEKDLLARAEWIKVIGILSDKRTQADSIFNVIEERVTQYKSIAKKQPHKPKVLLNTLYGDTWFVPQKNNSTATMINDAHGKYVFDHEEGTGSIPLGYETVLLYGQQADIWLNASSFDDLKQMGDVDERYRKFKAFQNKQVYSFKKGAGTGSYYFEYAYARPDWLMHDLIKIFHPEIFKKDSLYFYKKLQ